MEHFASTLSAFMDRHVIDKTGIAGEFNIRLSFAPDEHVLDAEIGRALHPFARKPGDPNRLRERLMDHADLVGKGEPARTSGRGEGP